MAGAVRQRSHIRSKHYTLTQEGEVYYNKLLVSCLSCWDLGIWWQELGDLNVLYL